ncbi:hypothetical protein G6F66_014491 [Rhizopus arrhizus]|nr:hypothetical protein G6F66_014491 [Rhizopus arrhizus]
MLVFTDSQTASLKDIGYYQQSIVAPLVGQTKARMGTTLGDIVNDDLALYPAITKVTTSLGVPWFHLAQNLWPGHLCGGRGWRQFRVPRRRGV